MMLIVVENSKSISRKKSILIVENCILIVDDGRCLMLTLMAKASASKNAFPPGRICSLPNWFDLGIKMTMMMTMMMVMMMMKLMVPMMT